MATDHTKGKLLVGDCLTTLKTLADNSIDSIVTDPPYGIEFMGKEWDSFKAKKDDEQPGTASGQTKTWCSAESSGIGIQAPRFGTQTRSDQLAFQQWYEQVARECLRVLKPGGHFLSFGATRMYHRMAVAIEDAGFEIRDSIHWTYGSGFPKSMNISKAIDKAAGVKFIKKPASGVGFMNAEGAGGYNTTINQLEQVGNSTKEAKQWDGWGTALKPSHEPIVVARKPLIGTVAETVLQHGTGGINIDASRIGNAGGTARDGKATMPNDSGWENMKGHGIQELNAGRFPANTLLTHNHDCDTTCTPNCPVDLLDQQSGVSKSTGGRIGKKSISTVTNVPAGEYEAGDPGFGDTGGASRFFHNSEWSEADNLTPFIYQAKPGKKERDAGLAELPEQEFVQFQTANGTSGKASSLSEGRDTKYRNIHPTVKPVQLMRYLIRMVTPPNGVVLDPFLGSGTTAVAATLEGYDWKGCELTEDYLAIIKGRVTWAVAEKKKLNKQAKQLTLEEQV